MMHMFFACFLVSASYLRPWAVLSMLVHCKGGTYANDSEHRQ